MMSLPHPSINLKEIVSPKMEIVFLGIGVLSHSQGLHQVKMYRIELCWCRLRSNFPLIVKRSDLKVKIHKFVVLKTL